MGLLAITWMALAPVLHCEFVNIDDAEYITNNPLVYAGVTIKGIAWAFTNTHFMHWFPLTYFSHMVMCTLGGSDPWWHHLCNLLLHACNVLLLFGVLKRMTGATWQSAMVAALFAVHPLNVESVAWISERSNVLSTLFWILTLVAYVDYVQKPSLGRYCVILVSYALGYLSKPMVVTLPVILLLLDYWPLDRWNERWKLIREKVPLFVMAIAGGVMTLINQYNIGVLGSLEHFPLQTRVSSTIWSYGTYLTKIFWPMRLAVFYPHPGNSLPWTLVCFEAVLLLVVTGILLLLSRQYRYLAVGWFWFGIAVAPVSGLMQAGDHAMADRYMYVPAIGIFIAVVWGLSDVISGFRKRRFVLFAQITLGVGVFTALIMVPVTTILQERTTEDIRGRVYGVLSAFGGGVSILPVVGAGTLADTIGVGKTILIFSGIILFYGVYRVIKRTV